MVFLKASFLSFLFLASSSLYAEEKKPEIRQFKIVPKVQCCDGSHDHHHGHHSEMPVVSLEEAVPVTEEKAVLETLDAFHNALEDGHIHNHGVKDFFKSLVQKETWKKWIKKMNLAKPAVSAYRVYQIKSQNPALREHALNLAFIFPLSHAVEMASGPIASSLAVHFGAPDLVTYGLGVAGGIISVPGIDPLCLLIYSSYSLKPVRTAITSFRAGTTNVFQFVTTVTGLNALYKSQVQFVNAVDSIEKENSFYKLEFTEENGKAFLSHLILKPEALLPENKKALKKAAKNLHWNIRNAVLEAVNNLTNAKPQGFYVEMVEEEKDSSVSVYFSDYSVPVPPKLTFPFFKKVKDEFCDLFLKKDE